MRSPPRASKYRAAFDAFLVARAGAAEAALGRAVAALLALEAELGATDKDDPARAEKVTRLARERRSKRHAKYAVVTYLR